MKFSGGRRGGKTSSCFSTQEHRCFPAILNGYFGPAGSVLWAYIGLCFGRTLNEQERREIEVTYLGHKE